MGVAGTIRELACDRLLPVGEHHGEAIAPTRSGPSVTDLMADFEGFDPDARQRAYAIALRRVALQLVYQIDATWADSDASSEHAHVDEVLEEIRGIRGLGPIGAERIGTLVRGTWDRRGEADRAMRELAPQWPTSRQPAIDRALLRLAFFEIRAGLTPGRIVVNEAVELAKRFSTEKSPAFINGLLGKVIRAVEPGSGGSAPPAAARAGEGVTTSREE